MSKRTSDSGRVRDRGPIERATECDSPEVENQKPDLETCSLVVKYLLGKTDGLICRYGCHYEEWRQAVRDRSKL